MLLWPWLRVMEGFDSKKWIDCITKPASKSHITSERKSGVSRCRLTLSLVFECRADLEISQNTHENPISLYFHLSGSAFGTHSHKPPCSPVCFQSKHLLWNRYWWVFGQAPCCAAVFPSVQCALQNVCGCAKQRWGLKRWGGEGFTVDLAVARSWASSVCKGGTLASTHWR